MKLVNVFLNVQLDMLFKTKNVKKSVMIINLLIIQIK